MFDFERNIQYNVLVSISLECIVNSAFCFG